MDDTKKFHDLLTDFRTAMLVTHGSDKGFHTRPMALAGVEADCTVYFFSSRASGKVQEIRDDSEVQIVCQSPSSFLSLAGRGRVVRDEAKIAELWDERYKVWFAGGKSDPDLVLIQVTPSEGEYWDHQGANRLKYAFEAAKAYVTGTRPQMDQDQHGVAKFS